MLRRATIPLLLGVFYLLISAMAADYTPDEKAREQWRRAYGVYNFSSVDYPATFAIIAGISIILTVGVIFIVVGLLSMEPSKDSIIYRMATTRMKKD